MEYLVVEFNSKTSQPIDRGVVINDVHGSWRTNRKLFLAAGTYTIRLEPGEDHAGQPIDDFFPAFLSDIALQFTNPFDPKRIVFTSTV